MASKTKIRSFRFSEEIEEIINQQVGQTFSAKLERLIYNCYMLAPEKEKEVEKLDSLIAEKRKILSSLSSVYMDFSRRSKWISDSLSSISTLLSPPHDISY